MAQDSEKSRKNSTCCSNLHASSTFSPNSIEIIGSVTDSTDAFSTQFESRRDPKGRVVLVTCLFMRYHYLNGLLLLFKHDVG